MCVADWSNWSSKPLLTLKGVKEKTRAAVVLITCDRYNTCQTGSSHRSSSSEIGDAVLTWLDEMSYWDQKLTFQVKVDDITGPTSRWPGAEEHAPTLCHSWLACVGFGSPSDNKGPAEDTEHHIKVDLRTSSRTSELPQWPQNFLKNLRTSSRTSELLQVCQNELLQRCQKLFFFF